MAPPAPGGGKKMSVAVPGAATATSALASFASDKDKRVPLSTPGGIGAHALASAHGAQSGHEVDGPTGGGAHHKMSVAVPGGGGGHHAEPGHHKMSVAVPGGGGGHHAEPGHHKMSVAVPGGGGGHHAEPGHHKMSIAVPGGHGPADDHDKHGKKDKKDDKKGGVKKKKKVAGHGAHFESHLNPAELEELYPSMEARFPLDPSDLELNPESEGSLGHQTHNVEYADIAAVDFSLTSATTPAGSSLTWLSADTLNHHAANAPFNTPAERIAMYGPSAWRALPEWQTWLQKKKNKDLDSLQRPKLPPDALTTDRAAVARCFRLLRQNFEPVTIVGHEGRVEGGLSTKTPPGTAPDNTTLNNTRIDFSAAASSPNLGDRPKSQGLDQLAREGLNELLNAEGTQPISPRRPATVGNDGAPVRARGRREGSVGRQGTRNGGKLEAVPSSECMTMLELFQALSATGETFATSATAGSRTYHDNEEINVKHVEMMKDETKASFIKTLVTTYFPSVPDGRISVKKKAIYRFGEDSAISQPSVDRLKFIVEKLDEDLEGLEPEEEVHRDEIMNKKLAYMDKLQEATRPMKLYDACRRGDVDVVARVLSSEVSPHLVNTPDSSGRTPLFIAARNQHLHLSKYLIVACKADVNAALMEGNTALHEASATGGKDIVLLLLNKGADPTAANCYGETPLHLAARACGADACEALVRYGARVDAKTTKGGYTPLMVAAGAGGAEAVKKLMDLGADPHIKSAFYHTALIRAAAAGHDDCVDAIVNWKPDDGTGAVGVKKKKPGTATGKGKTAAKEKKAEGKEPKKEKEKEVAAKKKK